MVYYNPCDPLIGAVIEQVSIHEADKSIISLIVRRKDGKLRDVRRILNENNDFLIDEFPLDG